jgi:uncharacterized membrane protein YgcG
MKYARARDRRAAGGLAWLLALSAAAPASAPGRAAAAVKVACIGAQTTHSHQLTRDKEYPAMLQVLLGPAYEVGNFGDCCATVLQGYPRQRETHPYLEGGEAYGEILGYHDSVKFAPSVVVIGSWGKHDTEIADQLYKGVLDRVKFEKDFDALVTTYLELPTRPRVFVSLPIPIPFGQPKGVTTEVILPAIKAVAAKYQLPIIDLYAPFLNHPELFKDETHVTDNQGLHRIADSVHAAMTAAGSDGGVAADAREEGKDAATAPAPSLDASGPADTGRGEGGSGGSAGAGGRTGGAGGGQAGGGGRGGATPSPEPDAAPPGGGKQAADAGCGCRLGSRDGRGSLASAVVLAVVALYLRRRRGR